MIKCSYCGKQISTAKYKTVKGKKYHYECYAQMTQEQNQEKAAIKESFSDDTYQKLLDYIADLYSEISSVKDAKRLASQQIEQLVNNYGYSYQGIQKTLIYFHEILGNPCYERVSIMIVPYYYDEAKEFYQSMYDVNEANSGKEVSKKKVVVRASQPDCKLSMIDVGEL